MLVLMGGLHGEFELKGRAAEIQLLDKYARLEEALNLWKTGLCGFA